MRMVLGLLISGNVAMDYRETNLSALEDSCAQYLVESFSEAFFSFCLTRATSVRILLHTVRSYYSNTHLVLSPCMESSISP
jgi:hypothetical protein